MAKRLIALLVVLLLGGLLFEAGKPREDATAFELPERIRPAVTPQKAERRTAAVTGTRSPRSVEQILDSVDKLARDDQAGLDALFAEMREKIGADPDAAFAEFVSRIPSFAEVPIEHSFFEVHCLMHFGNRPGDVVKSVLEYAVPGKRTAGDPHGHHVTPWEQYERVKAFAIRHFREGIAGGQISRRSEPDLVSHLKEIAQREPSLNIAREATKLLAKISPHAESDLEEALRHRSADERKFLVP